MARRYLRIFLLALTAGTASFPGAAAPPAAGPSYIDLNPPFTVNVGEPSTQVSFAKVDVSLRMDDPIRQDRVMHHQPGIRDILVSSLSNQPLSRVQSSEGRETLRTETLEKVQEFLLQEEGEALVLDLLFTSFIVQR